MALSMTFNTKKTTVHSKTNMALSMHDYAIAGVVTLRHELWRSPKITIILKSL